MIKLGELCIQQMFVIVHYEKYLILPMFQNCEDQSKQNYNSTHLLHGCGSWPVTARTEKLTRVCGSKALRLGLQNDSVSCL